MIEEEKAIESKSQRYIQLMNDNKWVVKLDRLGKNLEYIKNAEKQIRQH